MGRGEVTEAAGHQSEADGPQARESCVMQSRLRFMVVLPVGLPPRPLSTTVSLQNIGVDQLSHNTPFRHTAGLAVDNCVTSWSYNNRTRNWPNDAAPRHADSLAIHHGIGWPRAHDDSGKRYQRDQRQPGTRHTYDANHDRSSLAAIEPLP